MKDIILENIERFRQDYPNTPEHSFVPWYLTERFGISPTTAIMQSADTAVGFKGPGYDKNIDGFHLKKDSDKITLHLIQGKYSTDLNYITSGIKGFSEKTLDWLAINLKNGINDFGEQNKVLRNLRAELQGLTEDERKKLIIEFLVIHLSTNDHLSIVAKTNSAKKELEQKFREKIPSLDFRVYLEGPNEILNLNPSLKQASPIVEITFEGIPIRENKQSSQMFLGVGKLSEIVEFYDDRRDNLFAKNVRLFIKSKKNTEKGPSAKIKETLRSLCINNQSEDPSKFAFLHNGITMEARDVNFSEGILSMREPYVLNGCQTIMTAVIFKSNTKGKIDEEQWENISVPIKVIDTSDDKFIRKITTSTNRQNAISASALRANEPEQIKLETEFRRIGIFYERQQGAYDFLSDTNSKALKDEFPNSEYGPVNIENIARTLAAISGEIGIAKSVTDLFESDAAYERCFSEKRTRSKHLLVFLQNVHNVLPLVLQKDLFPKKDDEDSIWKDSKIKSGAILYQILCLLMRYLVKNKEFGFVSEFANEIWGKDGYFREQLTKQLDNRHSGIKNEIRDRFICLPNSNQEAINGAFRSISNKLRLTDTIDCFAPFENFDDELDNE